MKTRTLVCSVICAISMFNTAMGKTPIIDGSAPEQFFSFGVRAGMMTSNVSDNSRLLLPEIMQYNVFWRSGITVGAVADLAINNFVSIKPGVNFQSRCYDVTQMYSSKKTLSMHSSYMHAKFYYINVPILLSLKANLGESARLSLEAGPYFAYGLGGTRKTTSFDAAETESPTTDASFGASYSKCDYFGADSGAAIPVKRSDWGITMGAELTVLKHYCIGAHYEAGLKNTAINDDAAPRKNSLKNQAWRFTLGYNF